MRKNKNDAKEGRSRRGKKTIRNELNERDRYEKK